MHFLCEGACVFSPPLVQELDIVAEDMARERLQQVSCLGGLAVVGPPADLQHCVCPGSVQISVMNEEGM